MNCEYDLYSQEGCRLKEEHGLMKLDSEWHREKEPPVVCVLSYALSDVESGHQWQHSNTFTAWTFDSIEQQVAAMHRHAREARCALMGAVLTVLTIDDLAELRGE